MNPTPIIAAYQWLELPNEIRLKLHDDLGLKKSVGVQVEQRVINNKVQGILVSDGHTQEDLLAITVKKLQEYTQSESEDLPFLFQEAIRKAACLLESIPFEPDPMSGKKVGKEKLDIKPLSDNNKVDEKPVQKETKGGKSKNKGANRSGHKK